MAKEGKKSRWYQYSFEDVYGKEWKTKPQVPHAQLTLDDIWNKRNHIRRISSEIS